MTATRDYVFQLGAHNIDLKTNYVTEFHDNSNTSERVVNQYKLSKAGIVQTIGKGSSTALQNCELNGDENMIPILLPSSGKKTEKHSYL